MKEFHSLCSASFLLFSFHFLFVSFALIPLRVALTAPAPPEMNYITQEASLSCSSWMQWADLRPGFILSFRSDVLDVCPAEQRAAAGLSSGVTSTGRTGPQSVDLPCVHQLVDI